MKLVSSLLYPGQLQHIMKSTSTSLGLLSGSNFAYASGTAGKLIRQVLPRDQILHMVRKIAETFDQDSLTKEHKAPAKLQLNTELVSPFIYYTNLGIL